MRAMIPSLHPAETVREQSAYSTFVIDGGRTCSALSWYLCRYEQLSLQDRLYGSPVKL